MNWTLNLTCNRRYKEEWTFRWILGGWEISTPKGTVTTDLEGKSERTSGHPTVKDLYSSFVHEGIVWPSQLPKYLGHLWEALSRDPSRDITEAANQLEAWIEAGRQFKPRDALFHDPII